MPTWDASKIRTDVCDTSEEGTLPASSLFPNVRNLLGNIKRASRKCGKVG
jgi:hypothetical protein